MRIKGGAGSSADVPDGDRERLVLATGPHRTVVCALLSDRTSPAQDYFDLLDIGDRAKFQTLFTYLAQFGSIKNTEKFRPKVHTIRCDSTNASTEYHVCEFKVHTGEGKRIMGCLDGREWVLTHGFSKGGRVKTEGHRAGEIFCEDRYVRHKASHSKGGRDGSRR